MSNEAKASSIDVTYMPDTTWRTATIPKKSGGVRVLRIPNDDLKSVQRKLLNYLYTFKALRPMYSAVGFVPGRDTMSGVIQHSRNAAFVLCMDIKNFFDSVPFSKVEQNLLKAGVPATIVDYIGKTCLCDGKCSQGAPTSPYLANIALQRFDKIMTYYCKKHGLVYSRYADDIAISVCPSGLTFDGGIQDNPYYTILAGKLVRKPQSKAHIDRLILLTSRLLTKHVGPSMKLKHKKTRVAWRNGMSGRRITGVVLRNDWEGYNAPRKFRRVTRAMLHNLYVELRDLKPNAHLSEYRAKWAMIKGRIFYCDRLRQHSVTLEAAMDDPLFPEAEVDYVTSRLEKKTRGRQPKQSHVSVE